MPLVHPPVHLQPPIYDAWLAENPKIIEGGPVQLESVPDALDSDMVILPSYHVDCEELPRHYADNLMIFGTSNEFEGFMVWVTPEGFDYLLMAHHRHHSGEFEDQYGNKYQDHPHFHELDLYRKPKDGRPRTKHIVPLTIRKEMPAHKFLEAFLDHYYFDDNRVGGISPAARENSSQRRIHDDYR